MHQSIEPPPELIMEGIVRAPWWRSGPQKAQYPSAAARRALLVCVRVADESPTAGDRCARGVRHAGGIRAPRLARSNLAPHTAQKVINRQDGADRIHQKLEWLRT